MTASDREGFTVRVLRAGSAVPAGVGFVVGERHIITCAHVVNTALGRAQRTPDRPAPEIRIGVEFPLLGDADGSPKRTCKVAAWTPPPASGLSGGDVAGLTLVGEGLPDGAGPARLMTVGRAQNIEVDVFGYPGDPPRLQNGAWALLRFRGSVGGGPIQIDPDPDSALRAQP